MAGLRSTTSWEPKKSDVEQDGNILSGCSLSCNFDSAVTLKCQESADSKPKLTYRQQMR